MAHKDDLIARDILRYLKVQEEKTLLRFITCGSVDDGKSTLIGRLLYDSKLVFEDQLAALACESKKLGTQGDDLDLALLVDGLAAEREQGITIDVAWRFFSTARRKFIVADTPGHEQYTRNMATGASGAQAALILVDACRGVQTQTCRHSTIVQLLGLRHLAVVVNKMDLVDYGQDRFDEIVRDYQDFAGRAGLDAVSFIPVSALKGDNITGKSENMGWYGGPNLMTWLESVEVSSALEQQPFRFPVQWVNRPHADFRGFGGLIASGSVAPGDRLVVAPSGQVATVARIVTFDGDLEGAVAGQSVTLTLDREIDVSRGDLLAKADERPHQSDQFCATLLWMATDALLPGRSYLLKSATTTAQAVVTSLHHKINVNTREELACKTLELNEIGVCDLGLDRSLAFDPYAQNRTTGSFILIDRLNNQTVGAGMISHSLQRAGNITWHDMDVNKSGRAQQKCQKPAVLWFTGLSGAGKSTVANLVERRLFALGHHTYSLDGDNLRHGLNRDLGFSDADRVENIRRVCETAKLFVDAGLVTLVSLISPFRSERQMVRETLDSGEFIEIFVDAPLAVCEERDPKGLYRKARAGEIRNFTGIDSDYEAPQQPELHLNAGDKTAEQLAEQVMTYLRQSGYI